MKPFNVSNQDELVWGKSGKDDLARESHSKYKVAAHINATCLARWAIWFYMCAHIGTMQSREVYSTKSADRMQTSVY